MIHTLSVIIPAYNEENTIQQILDEVLILELPGVKLELVIINDCSTDGTRSLVESYINEHPADAIRLINQEKNKGKGAAIRRGIEEAGGDFLIIQDADLEYDPREYKDLLNPLLSDKPNLKP